MDSIFIQCQLIENVKLKPQHLHPDLVKVLHDQLKRKYEGICSHHGYIKPESITVLEYSLGRTQTFSLNGDVVFKVKFSAQVCCPAIGNTIQGIVVKINRFGILAECRVLINERLVTVIEIVIPKDNVDPDLENVLNSIEIGHEVNVMIVGRKYELNDTKIYIVGKLIQSHLPIINETEESDVESVDEEYNEEYNEEEQSDDEDNAEDNVGKKKSKNQDTDDDESDDDGSEASESEVSEETDSDDGLTEDVDQNNDEEDADDGLTKIEENSSESSFDGMEDDFDMSDMEDDATDDSTDNDD